MSDYTNNAANRLKSIRERLGINRAAFSRQSGIAEVTLRKWESGTSPLTKLGAARCVTGYMKLGILTSIEWILDGAGEEPNLVINSKPQSLNQYSFELLRQMYDSSSIFVSYVDKHERFQIVNKKYEAIFNLPSSKICGRRLSEMIGVQGYKVCKPYINRALAGETVKFEYAWEFEKNKYRYLKLQYVPFLDTNSQVQGFFSYIEDSEPFNNDAKLSKLEAILPLLPKKKFKFAPESFKKALDIVCENLSMRGLSVSDHDIVLLSKHLYSYSMLNPTEEMTQYIRRIIDVALTTDALS